MVNNFGLSQFDRNLLISTNSVDGTFGSDPLDYAKVYVFDMNDILQGNFNISATEFNFENQYININVGTHLRDNGFLEGTYKVFYHFYRPIAGSSSIVYLEPDKTISNEEIENTLIAGKNYYSYTNSNGETTIVNPVELGYYISKISTDKTELEIKLQNIDDTDYYNDFISLAEGKIYYPHTGTNSGVKFKSDKDDSTITLDIPESSTDPGFDSMLVGGTLVIPNVYTVAVRETPPLSEIDNRFDKTIDDSYFDDPERADQPDSPYIDQDGVKYEWEFIREKSSPGGSRPIDIYGWKESTGEDNIREEFRPFISTVTSYINPHTIVVEDTWDDYRKLLDDMGATVQNIYIKDILYPDSYVKYNTVNLNNLNIYFVVNNQSYLVTNVFKKDDSIFIKLYSPLSNVDTGNIGFFVEELIPTITDNIKIIPFNEDFELNNSVFLAVPNVNSENLPLEFRGTTFKSYDDLVGSDTSVIQEIENKLVSGSLLDVKLNIDYQKRTTELQDYDDNGFGNFINFSSAERRLKNFKYKLDLIETYTSQSGVYSPVASSTEMQSFYDTKVSEVKNSFDHYEHYLYYESSSYVSSSVGQFHDTSWPKENSSSPYTLSPTTSSIATTWYNNIISSASIYDTNNGSRLINNLPGHVKFDVESNTFITFMDMIGQQLDETWIYLKHFTDINDRQAKFSAGISKDIVKYVAKASGIEVYNGNDLLNLSEYLLGKDIDDGSQTYEKAQEEVTEEIWKRILANLPFFQRTKGTTRALKGLLNCYGIPSSILRVREYGGPDYNNGVTFDINRNFTYALDFRSSQYIKHLWTTDNVSGIVPETVEFRFRSPKRQNQTIVQKGNDWAISIQDGGTTNKGYLRFAVSASTGVQYITSSLQQFYNDEMWSVMLTRRSESGVDLSNDNISQNITYELVTKQYDATRFKINYQTSESLDSGIAEAGTALNAAFTSSAQVYVGGSGSAFDGNNFSGSIMEYRLWSEPLSQSKFDNHVRTPKSYDGNTTSSHYNNLIYRNTFDENQDLSLTSSVSNSVDVLSYNLTGTAVGYSANLYRSINEVEEMKIPNIGASRRNTNKIRIETGYLTGSLSPDVTLQKSSFDFAPVDSNRLGVYFSPTDVIDKDIIYSLADVNYDDYIGDPRDQFEYSYRGLDEVKVSYWQKYKNSNNFWDYLRILQYYDSGIFKQMKSLLPARANATLGILVEPNILNRSKEVVGKFPEFENLYFENANDFQPGVLGTRGVEPFVSSSDEQSWMTLMGEYPYYEGDVNAHHYEPQSGSIGTLGIPSLYKFDTIQTNEHLDTYATASITKGDIKYVYEEAVSPFISSSRLSEHNFLYKYYFSSSLSASRHPSFGTTPIHVGTNRQYSNYSHSLELSEYQTLAYDSPLFRAMYKGIEFGKNPDENYYPAVEISVTSPTRLITQEPGESRLTDDSKRNPADIKLKFNK